MFKQSPVKVANIIEEGRYGGPHARIVSVASRLRDYGVDTCVVFPIMDSETLSRRISDTNIQGIALRLTRLSKEKKIFVRYLMSFFPEIYQLYAFFKASQFDLIHVNGAYQLKGAIAGRLAGIPVIWHLNDTATPKAIKVIHSIVARFCAKGFIVAGQRVYSYYLKNRKSLEKKPCVEIQAPVKSTVFNPEFAGFNKSISMARGMKIVTVANVNPSKGLGTFIEMASVLNKRYQNINFFIAGAIHSSQIEYFKALEFMINREGLSNINFMGRVDDVRSVLKSADICVFSSVNEASPTSIWEAMSMEKPVVATDVGDVRTFIRDAENGFVVPVGDAEALADRVGNFIENENLRSKCGEKARIAVIKNMDNEVCALKHKLFYSQILGS